MLAKKIINLFCISLLELSKLYLINLGFDAAPINIFVHRLQSVKED